MARRSAAAARARMSLTPTSLRAPRVRTCASCRSPAPRSTPPTPTSSSRKSPRCWASSGRTWTPPPALVTRRWPSRTRSATRGRLQPTCPCPRLASRSCASRRRPRSPPVVSRSPTSAPPRSPSSSAATRRSPARPSPPRCGRTSRRRTSWTPRTSAGSSRTSPCPTSSASIASRASPCPSTCPPTSSPWSKWFVPNSTPLCHLGTGNRWAGIVLRGSDGMPQTTKITHVA
mmetsp:Transcript_2188/g.8502  ORF Transcript_2188/g.8502 Transcript_2188/m.8502 type:complete len:231 (-) Transcript_2188:89-781(-)